MPILRHAHFPFRGRFREGARLIGKGFLKEAGDVGGGILGLSIALIVMCVALYVMVRHVRGIWVKMIPLGT